MPVDVRHSDPALAFISQRRTPRRFGDPIFRVAVTGLGLLVLAVFGVMILKSVVTSWPALSTKIGELTGSKVWAPSQDQFGALAVVYGTVVTSVVAFVLAAPVSLGIALFLNEVAPKRLRLPLGYLTELLAAIPSVVFGLWGLIVLLPWLGEHVWTPLSEKLHWLPIFAGPASALSYASAGVILAIMIIPIVTSISREVIAVVPDSQREAVLALGATRWEMIRVAVIPHARSGLVGALMLGFGRAVGETVAVALVIGGSLNISTSLFAPGSTMASVIANEFPEATGFHVQSLVAVGVLLFALTIVINVSARLLVWRAERSST